MPSLRDRQHAAFWDYLLALDVATGRIHLSDLDLTWDDPQRDMTIRIDRPHDVTRANVTFAKSGDSVGLPALWPSIIELEGSFPLGYDHRGSAPLRHVPSGG